MFHGIVRIEKPNKLSARKINPQTQSVRSESITGETDMYQYRKSQCIRNKTKVARRSLGGWNQLLFPIDGLTLLFLFLLLFLAFFFLSVHLGLFALLPSSLVSQTV